jgi:hypothetical protein
MERREIVEVRLLKALKTGKGKILIPGIYTCPIPVDLIHEVSQNRGMVEVRYKQITMPQEQTQPETKEIEIPKEIKPDESVLRRRKK